MSGAGTTLVALEDDLVEIDLSFLFADFSTLSRQVCQRNFGQMLIGGFTQLEVASNPVLQELIDGEIELCQEP